MQSEPYSAEVCSKEPNYVGLYLSLQIIHLVSSAIAHKICLRKSFRKGIRTLLPRLQCFLNWLSNNYQHLFVSYNWCLAGDGSALRRHRTTKRGQANSRAYRTSKRSAHNQVLICQRSAQQKHDRSVWALFAIKYLSTGTCSCDGRDLWHLIFETCKDGQEKVSRIKGLPLWIQYGC